MIPRRDLGNSGISVSPFGFGGNVFGWTADERRSFELLDAFVGEGFQLVDTADCYSSWAPGHRGGESETVIGNWIRRSGKRSQVVIATKVGHDLMPGSRGLRRDYILRSVDDSLRRLQTDYIDLYQAHKDDPATPVAETLEAFAGLVKSGKVRTIGASNFSAARLAESLAVSAERGFPRYETLQPLYNLYDRADFERDLQPLCAREKVGVINYYSLASGFLTGKYRTEADLAKSVRGGGAVKSRFNERGLRILGGLDTVAKELGATPAQVAIAWLLSRDTIAAPLASATSLEQLRELLGGVRLRLDAGALAELERVSAP